MSKERKNVLGVLGGMGPLATVCFYRALVQHTKADLDSQHIDVVISGRASIPDRTAFILGQSKENPLDTLLAELDLLKILGATCIAIPCNTAHYWYNKLAEQPVPIINMIGETVRIISRNYKRVGIMATAGTIQAQVFQKPLEEAGLDVILPDKKQQEGIMEIIYSQVKKGLKVDLDLFRKIAKDFKRAGSEIIILGCTELSVINQEKPLGPSFIDPLEVLAFHSILACEGIPVGFPQEFHEVK